MLQCNIIFRRQPFREITMASSKLWSARSYDEWKSLALAEDERSGAARWRHDERSKRYDYKVIRKRLEELREIRGSGDPHALLFYLNEGIHGNMGGIGSSSMYKKALFGTKDLITDYNRELAEAIAYVGSISDEEISLAERLEFLRRASHCYGRTALMLSGGGSLGPFHLGVIKALFEQGLLPSVLSGSSAGSLICAIIGTRDVQGLESILQSDAVVPAFQGISSGQDVVQQSPERLEISEVRRLIAEIIPDMTFAEAFETSGRAINITVSPRDLHQQPRLLNAVTSPNVLIREAVLASCAVPGVFPPVTLAARSIDGERKPYVPSRQWVDGSMTDDLPAKRLARLYGVNHFVSSQINPFVIWALRDTARSDDLFSKLWEINQNASREWLKATYPFAMQATKSIYPLNILTRMGYNLATQDYTADINILPQRRLWDPRKLLAKLSEREIKKLIREGERQTWPKIEMVRNCTRISRTLDRLLNELEARSLEQVA